VGLESASAASSTGGGRSGSRRIGGFAWRASVFLAALPLVPPRVAGAFRPEAGSSTSVPISRNRA